VVDSALKARVKFISNRIGQLRLNKLCILGVYLPYNNNKDSINSLIEFEAELELVFQTIKLRQQEGYECIVIGDFNCDMNKHPERSNILSNYLTAFKYELVDQIHELSSNYTYQMVRKKKNSQELEYIKSFIDHVAVPSDTTNIKFIDILDEPGNNSDHNLILLKYNIDTNNQMEEMYCKPKKIKIKFDWNDEAFLKNYRERINKKMNDQTLKNLIKEIKLCKCFKKAPRLISELHKQLQSQIIECANKAYNELNKTIRSSRTIRRRKTNFWWDDTLKAIYELKKQYYIEYKNSGFNQDFKFNFLEQKKLFKIQKRYNIEKKRNKNLQLIDEMFKLNKNKFWRKVKKLGRSSPQIDAKMNDITKGYDELFNIKNHTESSKENDCKSRFNKLLEESKDHITDITVDKDLVRNSIKKLINNKAIGLTGMSNEMLKYSLLPVEDPNYTNDPVIEAIVTLYSSMINFKYSPDFFNISIIKPLVKDVTKETDTTNNLRAIAISDTLQNLYETILEDMVKKQAKTDDKQFGFKKNNSCAHAIMVIKQTMFVARKLHHRLYIAAIDAAKAFDKVNRDILWCKMLDIGVNETIVIAIFKYYEKSMMLIELDNEFGKPFKTSVGVRQGGVLSPLLYSIYINDILIELQKLKLGYYIGKTCVDVLAYADDILLIGKTKIDLQLLLAKLSSLGAELEIKFNADKSHFMIFNRFCQLTANEKLEDEWNEDLILADKPIKRVETIRYLGAILHDCNFNHAHLEKCRKAVAGSVAKLISLGMCHTLMNPNMKGELFKTHIRPVVMYAMENYSLNSNEFRILKCMEGNALKRLLGISTRCKSTDLFLSFDIMSTERRLKWLKLKHFLRMTENSYTHNFLNELNRLNMPDTFTDDIKKLTSIYDSIDGLSQVDKCDFAISAIEDQHEEDKILSRKCQQLKLVYQLSNHDEQNKIINKLLEF